MAEKFKTLVDMFERSATAFKDRALFGEKRDGAYRWVNYGDIHSRVKNLRAGLAAKGVGRGDMVAIISNNSSGWAVAAYATFGLGACWVSMYEAVKADEWEYITNDCKAKVLFVANPEIYKRLAAVRENLSSVEHIVLIAGKAEGAIAMADLEAEGAKAPVAAVEPDPSELAVLIYTSGTTGKPKGVQLTHANIVSNVNAVHESFPMTIDDRSLSFLPWAHSFGSTVELHCLVSCGASMGLAENTNTIVANLAEVRPTLLFSVPRIFNKIYDGVQAQMEAKPAFVRKLFKSGMNLASERKKRALGLFESLTLTIADKIVFAKVRAKFGGRLKYAFSGGAAISPEVANFIDNLGIMVYEGYGLSETSPIATANFPGTRKIGSVGKAIPGVRIEIDKTVLSEGDNPRGEGEIVIHGPNVMKGYLNLPDSSAEVLREDGGFRSGDLGFIDPDGYLFITGRIKEQYKLENGKYVAPAPMEEHLKLSPLINQIMVYGDNKPYNVAIVVPAADELKKWAATQGLGGKALDTLCKEPKVRELIQQELDKFGTKFKGYEAVRRCALVPDEFTPDNEMLTPTLKLKRRNVIKVFQGMIDGLYAEDA